MPPARSPPPIIIHWWSLLSTTLLILIGSELIDHSNAVRIRLHPDLEPDLHQVHNNYRMLAARSYYYLKSAGLLNDSMIEKQFLEDERDSRGKFVRGRFNFNSSEFIRKYSSIRWYIPYEEHSALQTYDDPRDRDLATGPQVNQELCGLHLDYMIHMVDKHCKNLDATTEMSIFNIMQTFDFPRLGLNQGNHMFLGNYMGCKSYKLNVMRKELVKVNRRAGEKYFKTMRDKQHLQAKRKQLDQSHGLGRVYKKFKTIANYMSPFFGYKLERDPPYKMEDYSDSIKMLPMRYCLSSLRWPSWPNTSYHIRNQNFKSAVCLPETCDSNSLKPHGDKITHLIRSQMTNYYEGFYISELYCLPDEKSELRNPFNYWSTVAFIVFNAIWLTVILVATLMFPHKKQQTSAGLGWRDLLICWSVRKNLRDFLAAKPSGSDIKDSEQRKSKLDTAPLEGFKVVSSFAVITSHAFVVGFASVWNVESAHYIMTKSWLAMASTIPPAVVNNFFVVTGIITSLILFKMSPKILTKPGFWFKFSLYRYIRIVPLYLFIHWFLKSVFRFLGDGPFWDYGTSHTAWSNICSNESWWTILLPSANFKSPALHCNGVGWYLGNDMQFILLTPIVIIMLTKKPIMGHIVLLLSIVGLIANHIKYFLQVDQDIRGQVEVSLLVLTRVLDETSKGYTYPQYRLPAFLIGLAAGHLLHLYEIDVIKKWPRAFLVYGKAYLYTTLYLLCFSPYLASLIPMENDKFVLVFGAFKEGMMHGITSIAAAILIMLLCTGHLKFLSEPYSWAKFRPLANASLCTLLIHIPLMFYYSQIMQSLPELSSYYIVTTTINWAIQAFLIAIAVHLLYELPMRKALVKLLLLISGEAKSKSPDSQQQQGRKPEEKPKQN